MTVSDLISNWFYIRYINVSNELIDLAGEIDTEWLGGQNAGMLGSCLMSQASKFSGLPASSHLIPHPNL